MIILSKKQIGQLGKNILPFSDAASDVLQLSLRLNTADTKHVVATLERFGYKVFDFSLAAEQSDDRLRDHIDSFLSYLQI